MKEYINKNPSIDVNQAEYIRLLGYPSDYELSEKSLELADWARGWYNKNGKPWIYSIMSKDINLSDGSLKVNNVEFNSKRLYKKFIKANVHNVFLTAVSAGKELEEKAHELWLQGKPDEYFFLEIYGSAIVEHLITNISFIFCDWADRNNKAILPHYSPGYYGWNISDQIHLFQLLKRISKNELLDRLNVLDSGMLNPKKSQLAVFGVTKNIEKVRKKSNLIPCKTCNLVSCQYRRIQYRHSLNQIENVKQLQLKK